MNRTMPPTRIMTQTTNGPRIYYLHPLLAGPLADWGTHFARASGLGFSHVLIAPPFRPMRHGSLFLSATHDALHPDLGWTGGAADGIAQMVQLARGAGLQLLLDVVPERVANASPLAATAGSPFTRPDTTLDPRQFDPDGDAAHAPLEIDALDPLIAFWGARLGAWAALGVAGFRLVGLHHVPPALVRGIADALAGSGTLLCGWMERVAQADLAGFIGSGLDYVFSSMPWWDGRGDWFWREDAALRRIAPVIASAEAPFGARLGEDQAGVAARIATLQRGLTLACLLGSGWMMSMGCEYAARRRLDPRRDTPEDFEQLRPDSAADLSEAIAALNHCRVRTPALSANSVPRLLSGPGAPILSLVRPISPDTRVAGDAALVEINLTATEATSTTTLPYANLGGYYPLVLPIPPAPLAPEAWRITTLHWQSPQQAPSESLAASARLATLRPRIAIEAISPSVDDGRFPARFCVGEAVRVEADIICDGHDVLAATVRWQGPGAAGDEWRRTPMRPIGNDRWAADFPLDRMGRYQFSIEAWKDEFATYRDELSKKFSAGLDLSLEVEEGRRLIASTEAHAGAHVRHVRALAGSLGQGSLNDHVTLLLSDETAALMREVDGHAFATTIEPPLPLQAERTAARFASWYEIFPRSMSGSTSRHGTFDDVIAQLPRVAAMGFDVLYFPPIHPIGMTNRKGRNNALVAGPDDPGSPYGIADHSAIHPELGGFADFARLRDAAADHGLEIALDFAVQCSPDHHWLREHQGWFDWRPDGSIRYAENPPKKYQDIVNVDFYKPDALDGLWQALCEVVLFWCEQGVRIFRVDNPHTKPLPFWQWLIDQVQARHPDVLFLAEAFTKPKMMNRLAKVGFSQSYTYFTWRETKEEFEAYLTELTTTVAREFFRPNFFVNTPDINPVFLQRSGRAGHLIRAALATTLAGLWGCYSGFELCEAAALPGKEEYLDSEKYEIRAWDWEKPGNIVPQITRLNWIRRLNPALQTHLGLTFLHADNEQVLYFEKATGDRSNVILVAINLDPSSVQETTFELPLWRWNLPDWAEVLVDDLVFDASYRWTGKTQFVRLDPNANPYAIWRIQPV
jgi:starch synthase (maltosyl-transferring)